MTGWYLLSMIWYGWYSGWTGVCLCWTDEERGESMIGGDLNRSVVRVIRPYGNEPPPEDDVCNHNTLDVMSCHVMSYYMVSCHIIWCHVMWCHVMWCGVMWCHVILYDVMSCGVMSCHDMWCGVVSTPSSTFWTHRIAIRCCPLVHWCDIININIININNIKITQYTQRPIYTPEEQDEVNLTTLLRKKICCCCCCSSSSSWWWWYSRI